MTTTTTSPGPALRRATKRAWWAEKRTVDERQRHVRAPDRRWCGTCTVAETQSIDAPLGRLYLAFVDPDVRRRWLPNVAMQASALRPGRSARFEWADGTEQINVTFAATGETKGQVAVEHTRLPSTPAAAEATIFWRSRLADLKALLES